MNIHESNSSLVLYESNTPGATQADQKQTEPHSRILRFHIVDHNAFVELPLAGRQSSHWLIGRKGGDANVDVDLSRFEAARMGVSREHIRIELAGPRIMVRDEGSVNGSRLNGQHMQAHYVYEIKHGDILQLGMMLVQISIVAA